MENQRYDLYPPNAPGMPPVGTDFIEESQLRGDTISKKHSKSANAKISIGPMLEDLLRSCLYDKGKALVNVTVKGSKKKQVPIISGHLWTDELNVPASGPVPADVMIIDKQMGEHEFKHSRHLVGQYAEYLYKTFIQLGVDPDEINTWYVTSLLKTANLEGNDVWRDSWVKNFNHLLHQELRLVKPKYILCLGANPLKCLFGKNMTLTKSEGQIFEYTFDTRRSYTEPEAMHTALVAACNHPYAILRSPDLDSKFQLAVNSFVQLVKGNRTDLPEEDLDHRIITTEAELAATVEEVLACGPNNIIAMDCEWHGEHPQNKGAYLRTIQFSWAHKKAACVVLRKAGGVPGFYRNKRIKQEDGTVKLSDELTTENSDVVIRSLLNKMMKNNRACGHFFNADLEWLIHYGLDFRPQFAAPATWQECKTKGGLDTALMAHAVDEVGDFSLTAQALQYTSAPRYDMGVIKWKETYCRDNKLKVSDLEGYGECPDEILQPYANYDADVSRRLALVHMKNLDSDIFGNNCWEAFWVSQRAVLSALEIKLVGIPLDNKKLDELTSLYMTEKDAIYARIREWANWPTLNLNSAFEMRELIFGPEFNGKKTSDGKSIKLSPDGARFINAVPLLTTDKRPKRWEELTPAEQKAATPATNRAVLSIMFHSAEQLLVYEQGKQVRKNCKDIISWIRDFRYVGQVLKSVLRPPATDDTNQIIVDEDDNWTYDAGLPGSVCDDGRIRTTIYQTKETGRWSSSRPPLQNVSKRREPDYKRILGDKYRWPLRSILTCPPGYVMVEADYVGAELFGMAIMSGDATMIDHANRNQLPEHDPNFYDIHSNIAKLSFGFTCPPTKAGLASIGMSHMRIVAKAVVFGVAYGRQAKAISLAAKEEGIDVTEHQAQAIIDTIFKLYPGLVDLFEECRSRAVNRVNGVDEAPRWLCGPFGRFRRFKDTTDKKIKGDIERQAQNCPIQGMIADAVSLAIANLYEYRENAYANGWTVDDLDYKIALQVHDAVMAFVRYDHVPYFINTVLKDCMIDGVPIYPSHLDGVPTGTGPYYLGIDSEVYFHWGVVPTPGQLQDVGIDPMYAHWSPGEGIIGGQTVTGYLQKEAYPGKIWVNNELKILDGKKK